MRGGYGGGTYRGVSVDHANFRLHEPEYANDAEEIRPYWKGSMRRGETVGTKDKELIPWAYKASPNKGWIPFETDVVGGCYQVVMR